MDPLANMLIQIKNAGGAGKKTVTVPYSNFKFAVAQALLREGYITGAFWRGKGTKKIIEVVLSYNGDNPKIKGVKRISKFSRRVYTNARSIKPVRQGCGALVLSTPSGILTGKEAKRKKIGGEALFEIW